MSTPNEAPDLGMMVPTEETHPDHREHAKQPKHLDDDELKRRAEHEREIVADARSNECLDADRPEAGSV